MTLLGATQIFAEVPKLVDSLLGINVSQSLVYRVTQTVSQKMEDPCQPSASLKDLQNQPDEQVYGMVDGSFLFTDCGWKAVKVGRVFQASPDQSVDYKWTLGTSEYVAQRGHYETFTHKFEGLLSPESVCKKVFITDGASWITNWLTKAYPDSLQILDFFHVCEKLAKVEEISNCKKGWFEIQKSNLLSGKIETICTSLKSLKYFEGQTELISYIEKNSFRMKYDEYRKKGLMISSGPIESAHRTVLQSRMKRSGQRWSDSGCDAMIKLRVAFQSGKNSLITNTFFNQAA